MVCSGSSLIYNFNFIKFFGFIDIVGVFMYLCDTTMDCSGASLLKFQFNFCFSYLLEPLKIGGFGTSKNEGKIMNIASEK